ncbi:hypothetical protein NEMBOFW57_008510 [Staphylotrichum longicolle]|uniref:YTH domain-containing protein n=1 Tax=Staphylotrichum longicolle TaxID=669026 RepID=A0AAD4HU49_9PEZI|nr:hypothetical protein NEMBOFW57_008510 [Staphylotrichum longicolle]
MPKTGGTSTESGQTATTSKETAHLEPISSEDIFARLLSQVPDLKDFLEMTGYFDVETRTRKLDRFRRVKALAAEKLRIEEEERKLMEEEELELGLQRSTVSRLPGTATSALAGSETPSLLTPATPMFAGALPTPATPMFAGALPTPVTPVLPGLKIDALGTAHTKPAKRAHDDDSSELSQKVPRLEPPPPPPSRPAGIDNKTREDGQRDRKPRDTSPPRRPYPQSSPGRDDRYRRSPPPRPRSRQSHDDYDSRPRYKRYKDDGSERRRDSGGQPVSYPIHVDLGRKGDTRFFIVKSFNEENVRRCMEDGLWTTQVQNGEILAEAYATCQNVILFFSVNKSRAFQGYARMATPPSPSNPPPTFTRSIHWDTSDPFRVQWLSKTHVEFFRIGHLKNSLNEGAAVLVGKDGQEVEEGCGRELVRRCMSLLDWLTVFATSLDNAHLHDFRSQVVGFPKRNIHLITCTPSPHPVHKRKPSIGI